MHEAVKFCLRRRSELYRTRSAFFKGKLKKHAGQIPFSPRTNQENMQGKSAFSLGMGEFSYLNNFELLLFLCAFSKIFVFCFAMNSENAYIRGVMFLEYYCSASMGKTLLPFILFSLLFCTSVAGQVSFQYDSYGARISRRFIVLKAMSADSIAVNDSLENVVVVDSLPSCQIAVTPNPTQGEVIVSITEAREDIPGTLLLYDRFGNLIFNMSTKGDAEVPIDLSGYPMDYYFLNFSQGDSRLFYKILKTE